MKKIVFLFLTMVLITQCKSNKKTQTNEKKIHFSREQANRLAKLPCKCIEQEYPNKLGQVLNDSSQLQSPKSLHPVFYGCFDWHSSVHGHWLLVNLLKKFPLLEKRSDLEALLDRQFDSTKIQQEIEFFKTKHNESFERTYGWAWVFKLQEELDTWNDPQAKKWGRSLRPLTLLLRDKLLDFLPKLVYPIRTGEHPNTAFALSFTHDYALVSKDKILEKAVIEHSKRFYLKDKNYSFSMEPSGYDFLSPGLEEIDLMRKILARKEFQSWLKAFHPQLFMKGFDLEVGKIKDRTDGKLVHLDGLNFSRAWCLYGLAKSDPNLAHLKAVADKHLNYSLPNIVDGDYMGEHWLASFACYALEKEEK